MKEEPIELISFTDIYEVGFRIEYDKKGTTKCKEDKYFLYYVNKDKKEILFAGREDELILLSALLNFAVHKKLVEIDNVGCYTEDDTV